jgi:hypothetical protein
MKKHASIVLGLAAVLALIAAGGINRRLFAQQPQHGAGIELQESTPLVTFVTVVLGGFRGVIADVLWLRATYLQDEGRFFELAQLSDWITQLEPHSAEIWGFHAWNMAYNISVLMGDEEERWRWVMHGLSLLRDRGVPANPREAMLYAELAWIYQQKIGGVQDSAHVFYKRRWASEMAELLPDGMLKTAGDAADLTTALRARFRLDAETMRRIDRQYGPLDWRVAKSHAVYWAEVGRGQRGPAGRLRCERILYQSMGTLFLLGRLPQQLTADGFPSRARPDLFPAVCRTFTAAEAAYPEDPHIPQAFRTFLETAVVLLDACGDTQQADEALLQLRTRNSDLRDADVETFVKSVNLDLWPGAVRNSILQERHYRQRGEKSP